MEIGGQLHSLAALLRERAPDIHLIGWVGPRASLDMVSKRKFSSPCRDSNPDHPIVQPVVSRHTNWAIRLDQFRRAALLQKVIISWSRNSLHLWHPRFRTLISRAHHFSLSWATWIHSKSSHTISLRCVLILISYLRLGLPNYVFPSAFPTRFQKVWNIIKI
jgi:hypothetical protein